MTVLLHRRDMSETEVRVAAWTAALDGTALGDAPAPVAEDRIGVGP